MTRAIALALAALALTAGPAAAKGGGKTTPPPAPTPEPVFVDVCEGYWDMPAYPDGSLPVVNRTSGGCVIVKHSLTGVNRLDFVVLSPGWTYVVESNGDGTSSRVQLAFTETATGNTASIRVENGKTSIR